MIGSLKRSSPALSKHIGFNTFLAQSEWRRRRLLVLCFHGISLDDEHRWKPGLYVSPDQFERRLAILKRYECNVLPLGDAVAALYRGELPDRAVVLTFDDGYFDFQEKAWPLLQRYQYPATVYLTTARMEHNFPIVNLFASYLLWQARDRVLDGRGILGLDGAYELATEEQRHRVVHEMDRAAHARAHRAQDKDLVVKALAERLGVDYQAMLARRVLTLLKPAEVERLSRAGIDFQLHTHLHRTPEDPALFLEDVRRNRQRIESVTGVRPDHLCYPSGVYRLAYLPGLRQDGIVSATTCDPGMAVRGSEPLLMPRFVDTSFITDVEFEAWVTGVASCLPRRTRRAHAAVH